MSSWFWDDCEGMSDIQKEQLAAFLDGKMPDLMNEIRETAEKFDRDIRESRGESVESDTSVGTTPLPSGIIIEEKIDGLSNENNTAQPTKKTDEITEEQNKKFTKIPWILMRANSLKRWCYWLVGAAANAGLTKFIETARAPYNPNDPVQLIVPLSWFVIVFWALANSYFDCQQYFEVDNIRKKMLKYKENMDDSLSFDDIGGYGINRGAIVRYLSKKNPEIFYRLVENKFSVKDDKIKENILLGHIKSCRNDGSKVFGFFDSSVPPRIARYIKRHNKSR